MTTAFHNLSNYSLPILPSNAVPQLLTASLNKLTHDAWLELGALTSVRCLIGYSILWTYHINHTHFTFFTNTMYELSADITFTFTVTWFSGLCRLYSSYHIVNIMFIFHSSHLDTFLSACSSGKILFHLVFIFQHVFVCHKCCTCNFHKLYIKILFKTK
jgi:hypothetical protein